jgi:Holliday junction resolvase RusA-like endonuclease
MKSKEYRINIVPIAWQRALRNGNRSYDAHTKDKVSFGLYLAQQHNDEPFYDKPIHLDVTFYMPIPKLLKDKPNSLYSVTTPSLDDLYKFFIDAIKDILISNVQVICSLTMKKVYDKEPRTELVITEVA